ncbi:hypothetical protein EMIHUDRAFT_449519 [Emiliania huxleyi CCMP1516]|uniref:Uncharacterized protein n=2 Tax=Emiliania huxleyi TaxID=2903 RepID=A0A0D3K8M5_EMIH1|nr:hypothetical protein EMIHUDRAFT_449519 [Emiliania huxleyi CCMP1516]EOD32110.1 hypothetical protein EMIHUDRAFT_449519 [Emiliania huxleyi CCMP1516]|eukprot:XP_005784539.1 hypothetical protein EMIHUDRAFT_449519 [Emiliania huxleyi CCMP1516]
MASSTAPSAPGCISWCSLTEITDFLERLPIVHDTSSRWYSWLQRVYGGKVPLPLDLQSLGVFTMPTKMASATFFNRACDGRPAPAPALCTQWLAERRRREVRTLRLPRGLSKDHERSARATAWTMSPADAKRAGLETFTTVRLLTLRDGSVVRFFFDSSHVGIYRTPNMLAPPPPSPNGSWIEVLREPAPEAAGYGCWFYPLVKPFSRGSGVFVNLGRTLAFPSRAVAMRTLKVPGSRDDEFWAREAARRGYDSIQLQRGPFGPPEIVITTGECIGEARLPTHTACPLPVEWTMRQPCAAPAVSPTNRVTVRTAEAEGEREARHREAVRWLSDLPADVCVLVCTAAPERASARTLPPSPRVAAFVVRNTIREASCYLRVLGDLFSLPAEKLPPMLVATQAHPHCRDPATNGGPLCVAELQQQLANTSEARARGGSLAAHGVSVCPSPQKASLEARGGFSIIGSLRPDSRFSDDVFGAGASTHWRTCVQRHVAQMAGVEEGGALALLQALRRSAIFQIGAQWIASKGAILRLRRCGALQSWIANIRGAAAAANAEPSDAPGYSFSACCDAPPSGNALFHLAALATEEEGEHGCAADSRGLAPLLGRRSVRWAQLSKAADGFGAAAREAAVAEAWALEELQQLAGGARDAARLLPKWAAAEREGLRAHLSSPLCRKPPAGLCPRVDGAGRALTLRELQALATAATAARRRVAQLDAAQRARLDGLLRDRQPLLPTGAAQIGSGGPSPAGLAKRLGALAAEVRH